MTFFCIQSAFLVVPVDPIFIRISGFVTYLIVE